MLDREEFAALLTAAVGEQLPGAVFALTDRDRPLLCLAAGQRRLEGAVPMRTDTVCHIASMTKPITAVAALLLVEQGKLSLDRPAGEVLAWLNDARVLTGFDPDGRPQTRPPARPLTLRHLLSHTAGCANETWSADTVRCIDRETDGEPGGNARYQASLRAPLLHDPGERWWYGMGVDLAGLMIEAASGVSLGQFLRERLFSPLGMHDTGFRLPPPQRDRRAEIYRRDGDDLRPLPPPPDVPEVERGGGGLYSTAADYLAFIRFILNGARVEPGGRRLLSEKSLALLTDNQLGALRVTPLAAALKRSNAMDILPEVEKTWTLGFMRNEQPVPDGRPAGGLFWAGINNTYFWIDRQNGLGGVLLCQLLPFLDEQVWRLYNDCERLVYRQLRGAG